MAQKQKPWRDFCENLVLEHCWTMFICVILPVILLLHFLCRHHFTSSSFFPPTHVHAVRKVHNNPYNTTLSLSFRYPEGYRAGNRMHANNFFIAKFFLHERWLSGARRIVTKPSRVGKGGLCRKEFTAQRWNRVERPPEKNRLREAMPRPHAFGCSRPIVRVKSSLLPRHNIPHLVAYVGELFHVARAHSAAATRRNFALPFLAISITCVVNSRRLRYLFVFRVLFL